MKAGLIMFVAVCMMEAAILGWILGYLSNWDFGMCAFASLGACFILNGLWVMSASKKSEEV